jgi:hypothetical protein
MVMDTSPQAQVAVMMGISSCEVSAAMPNVKLTGVRQRAAAGPE